MNKELKVGIHRIEFSTPNNYLNLETLANAHNIDPAKYIYGIGQSKMAVPTPDEDTISIAANAAQDLLDSISPDDIKNISTLIFATESGVDQSKSGAAYLMGLIDMHSNCRAFELKQACYGGTAGVQMACDMVRTRPEESVLVVACDIARYQQDTPGECTQGAGAVAMLIAANPDVIEIDAERGFHSEDIMDFWRPNDFKHALVDGELSKDAYLNVMVDSYESYLTNGGQTLNNLDWLCFHQPFTKMAKKAYEHLSAIYPEQMQEKADTTYTISQQYGREIGNTYTASLYIGLLSLLDNADTDLTGQKIGFFSYGSGAVGEFFSGTVNKNYRKVTNKQGNQSKLANRQALSYDTYSQYMYQLREYNQPNQRYNVSSNANFRLAAINNNKRVYERVFNQMSRAA
ncbi:hydroxymethylglutaryl-CoA synthase [Vibrio sp. Of7-15]|uniref:hydroxymethylglutaryl-CoA synthase n=1 Tax=Vibrio sp. Of7-15 TaxID=2724879 RepID=UPI001EF2F589|nr:hydroxymethylglutaryl-CoA synthase [Vibrio sp. Of7-15]MCG7500118.1 hydroxymethylglutaryl-CoA synthase [Vibrio sp. Of7-15]